VKNWTPKPWARRREPGRAPQPIAPIIEKLTPLPPARAENLRTLDEIWARRPCFVCDQLGWCQHREPVADVAEAEGHARSIEELALDRPHET